MRDIEKNDVDISVLFKWNKPVTIEDTLTGNSVTVYIRLGGDSDINRAKTHGFRKAALLRKELRTEGSDKRLSFLAGMDEFFESSTIVVQGILILQAQDLVEIAAKNVRVPEPKEPKTNAPQEVWEKYQLAVDNYPKRFKDAISIEVEKMRKREEDRLSKLSFEELYKIYENEVINRLCVEEMQTGFYDMCIFLNTYKTNEYMERVFSTIEDYENLHSSAREILTNAYKSLELGIDALKK